MREVSKVVGLAETSIRYRLTSLERRKIILAYPYLVDQHSLGRTSFRILIATKGNVQSLHKSIFNFIHQHPSGATFVRCAGSWDFELNFEVEAVSEVGPIIGDVTDTFSNSIRALTTLHEIAIHRAHHFPLLAGVPRDQERNLALRWAK
jgi:DNA-binding Lrp family transcriptional regulator